MGQAYEARLHYDAPRDCVAVEWPWFRTEYFRLTRGDDMERLAAALKVFFSRAREVSVSPKDKVVDILALRAAVEAAGKRVTKFNEQGKQEIPTFEELFHDTTWD